MKKGKGKRRLKAVQDAPETFVRGFLASALLSAVQDRAAGGGPTPWRRVIRHGVQGGAALTAATIAAEAVVTRQYGIGLAAVTVGGAAIAAAEAALQTINSMQEISHGQEEA